MSTKKHLAEINIPFSTYSKLFVCLDGLWHLELAINYGLEQQITGHKNFIITNYLLSKSVKTKKLRKVDEPVARPRGEEPRTAVTVRNGYGASKPAYKNGHNFYTNRFPAKYDISIDAESDEESIGHIFFKIKK